MCLRNCLKVIHREMHAVPERAKHSRKKTSVISCTEREREGTVRETARLSDSDARSPEAMGARADGSQCLLLYVDLLATVRLVDWHEKTWL